MVSCVLVFILLAFMLVFFVASIPVCFIRLQTNAPHSSAYTSQRGESETRNVGSIHFLAFGKAKERSF